MTDIRVNPYEVIVAYHEMTEAEELVAWADSVYLALPEDQARLDEAKKRYEALKDPS